MPELPEVETMRRGILGIVGSRVTDIRAVKCSRRPILITPRIDQLRRRIKGQEVAAVDRLGKRVVVRLASADALIFEPRMTGLVLLADPPTREHLRVHLTFAGGEVTDLWYWDRRGLGSVRLFSEAELAELLGANKLGPDALALDADAFRERLAASRREIKVALLDQRAVAGIGNLYASEMLHRSAIHPQKRCDRLKPDDWRRLHAAMRDVLLTAIRYEGSTLGDGTYRNALNKEGGYQNHHRVYARAGELCPVCEKREVVRIVQAQRATFFCPGCQRLARVRT